MFKCPTMREWHIFATSTVAGGMHHKSTVSTIMMGIKMVSDVQFRAPQDL